MRKVATSSKDRIPGAERKLFKGWFNFSHELHVMYAQAYSERQAWMHFCRRIAKKHDVPLRMVMGHFDGSIDNYVIKKEEGHEPTV